MKKGDSVTLSRWLPKSVSCLRYYNYFRFRADLRAGPILAAQIFPASIAIAVASGVHPIYGVSCAAMAGLLASGLGESKVRISTPNILFIAVALNVVSRHGVLGLSSLALLTGIFLVFLGGTGLTAAVPFIPRAIVAGLSSGLAVLVVVTLVPDLYGVRPLIFGGVTSTGIMAILQQASLIEPSALIMATATFALILICRKASALIPASLIVTLLGALLVKFRHLPVLPIGSSYGSVLSPFPPFPTGSLKLDFLGGVLGPAFAIAILSASQSLEAMDLACGLAGERYSSAVELLVQGVASVGCALVGGLPTSGSYLYTSTQVRGRAQTPVAGMLTAVLVLAFFFIAVPLVPSIPLPVISGVILSSVCTMSHWREIPRLVKLSKPDGCAYIATALLTIFTDLLTALAAGVLIGMLLYIRKRRLEPTFFERPTV